MADYVLQIRYGEDDEPVRIPLTGISPDDAENKRQSLATEIDHALEMDAPLVFSDATDDDPEAGVPIDPKRVTSVELIDALPSS